MKTIAVLNTKGGGGKSTIATALAVRATADFERVCLVDLDPQQGTARWWKHRGQMPPPEVMVGETSAADALEALIQTGWDVAIFDGAPGSLSLTEEAIQTVDFIVIPFRASDQDIGSAEFAVALCMRLRKPYLLVLNEVMPRGPNRIDKRADEAASALISAGQPLAKTRLSHRVSYSDAMNVGKTAAELDRGRDKTASAEIDALFREVMAAIKAAATQPKGGVR
jgi:chromosome partitioning protein